MFVSDVDFGLMGRTDVRNPINVLTVSEGAPIRTRRAASSAGPTTTLSGKHNARNNSGRNPTQNQVVDDTTCEVKMIAEVNLKRATGITTLANAVTNSALASIQISKHTMFVEAGTTQSITKMIT